VVLLLYAWYKINIYFTYKSIRNSETNELLPLVPPTFLVGSGLSIYNDLPNFFLNARDKYGNLFVYFVGVKPIIAISDPAIIEELLVNHVEDIDRGDTGNNLKYLIGEKNVLLTVGEEWKHQRRVITTSFRSGSIIGMHSRIFETIKIQIDKWKAQCTDKPYSQALINTAVDVPKLSLNMISAMIFAETQTTDEFSNIFQKGISGLLRIRLLQYMPFSKYIPNFILNQESIESCISFFEVWVRKIVNIVEKDPDNVSTKNCIGHVLVKARDEDTNESFTFREIKDNIIALYFTGHETFSSLLNYAITNVALNPEIQKKCNKKWIIL